MNLNLEKGDLRYIGDTVYQNDDGNCVFCFDEENCAYGIYRILLRNLLKMVDRQYRILSEEDYVDDQDRITTEITTNLPWGKYEETIGQGIIPQFTKDDGKRYITLEGADGVKKNYEVARLVLETFCPNPDPSRYKYVRHKDGDLLNNRFDNLEWSETEE